MNSQDFFRPDLHSKKNLAFVLANCRLFSFNWLQTRSIYILYFICMEAFTVSYLSGRISEYLIAAVLDNSRILMCGT